MTQYATFFVPRGDGGVAREALNTFLRSRRVLRVETAFAGDGWAFCVEWMEGPAGRVERSAGRGVDYREVLPPETFAVFARLRERRKELAAAEGVAPYMIMTDAQLAETAKLKEPGLAALKRIPGVGEARAEKYGARLLEVLAEDTAEGGRKKDGGPPRAADG